MNRNEVIALRESRAKAHAFLSTLLAQEQKPEVRSQVDKVLADIDVLTGRINLAENPNGYTPSTSYDPNANKRAAAFSQWLRRGAEKLTAEQRTLLETRDVSEGAPMLNHIGTGYTSLGFFVPTGFRDMIEDATKYYSDLTKVCTVLDTDSGNVIPMPTSNDTTQAAVIVGESQPISEADPTASQIDLAAYKLSAGVVKCSVELLQDSAFNLEKWLAERFGIRYGRGYESYFTNGTGSTGSPAQPFGILPAIAASGATAVTAAGSSANSGNVSETGANSIGYADLVNLEHSVDPSYRRGARYMFHDKTLGQLKLILDKFGRPIWVPGVAVNAPDSILGYEYVINQSMPQIAPSATTVAFGDFSKYIIRRVKAMQVQRLVELYAVNGQVGFLSTSRVDGTLLDAGTHPLNTLVQHS
jgi:HK97 family phage major capsid protein